MNTQSQAVSPAGVQYGEERVYPLNKLKKSPRNVRKVGHSEAEIEARAASIQAKGLISPLVVEPELRADGTATGYGLVTAGEGRRLALRLLAKRKVISKTTPVRCLVDTVNDPQEISLDENVSRSALHPADEFEAFRDQAERRGLGAEEIGARFGVTAAVVRQRLRLGAVASDLLDVYRQGGLTLDQLQAFAISEDHARQRQVFETLTNRQPYAIRRAMTETTALVGDRRVTFVGLPAYLDAGGTILRDLFSEDDGGYVEDVPLLDRLVAEKLSALATEVRETEGWRWTAAYLDYPHGHGLSRVYPRQVVREDAEQARLDALRDEYAALSEEWGAVEDLPAEIDARLSGIEDALAASPDVAFDPAEVAYAGAMIILGHDGAVRIERGLVRAEDVPPPPAPEEEAGEGEDAGDGEDGAPPWDEDEAAGAEDHAEPDEPEGDATAPLAARLVADLTAHRTMAMRETLARSPDLALVALTHALVLRAFVQYGAMPTCLDIRLTSYSLSGEADGIDGSSAALAVAERHAAWAAHVPTDAADIWAFVVGLDLDSRMSLLAHCVGLSVNALHGYERRPGAWAHADQLAAALDLDMADWWSPTADHYLARVTKAHTLAAVREAVSPEAAERLRGEKKDALIAAAEPQLVAARWLPKLLRTSRVEPDGPGEALGEAQAPTDPKQAEPDALEEVRELVAAE
ncbi:ParB/RepB/Spo0J family partition protein [Caulobacter sp. 602-1]|uniref:ParB/RepB/Spo0J family partition protein n=1 Tax=Caulobacter sp. 602-1 TaxID=2492472 RepID=UPI0013154DFC|nr:ParB/RepB/Spo0J family partition protein [Caulobacter sp. 602-1]